MHKAHRKKPAGTRARIWLGLACFAVSACLLSCAKTDETAPTASSSSPAPTAVQTEPVDRTSPSTPEETQQYRKEGQNMGTYTEQDRNISVNGQFLRGTAWIPDGDGPFPTVIVSHGLGGTHHAGRQFAEVLCPKGVAIYSLDFRGGSPMSESSGTTQEMSVLTEVEDLDTVLTQIRSWDFADPEKIFLLGESQGGIVSAVEAARRPDDVAGLILLYPAFSIPDTVRSLFPVYEDMPETYAVLDWFPAGRPYAEDVYNYDPYEEIGDYTGPVLLLHGDEDHLIPTSYSERAAEVYDNAELHIVEGAGHGLEGSGFSTYIQYIEPFLEKLL